MKWPTLRAVRAGNLYTVSADLIARSTPRIVEGAHQVCRALDEARGKIGSTKSDNVRTH